MKIHPLNRSITLTCILFFLLLTAIQSYVTYRIYTVSMYERYQKQLSSILTYLESYIDHDDLSECAQTLVESEKYKELQALFDHMIDTYQDVHYLYIMDARLYTDPISLMEICSANSSYEKEFEPENVLHLGDWTEGWYPEEVIRDFAKIQEGNEDVYFTNPSAWGEDYTLARPLIDSSGRHYALLCADISLEEINNNIYEKIYQNVAILLILGFLLILILLLWLRRNVTTPIKQLEESVSSFAANTTGKRDPDELVFHVPDIKPQNEVKALAKAVEKLSLDMSGYAKGLLEAERESTSLKSQVFTDPLTKLRNKAAYDKICEELDWDIRNNIAEFALVMVDMNYLKQVNDHYGHEHGNEYIVGGSQKISEVFEHSLAYRIGGDEFIVILQGWDYDHREELVERLRQEFAKSKNNQEAHPWLRYSAGVGISAYKAGDQMSTVFKRADQDMYKDKKRVKTSFPSLTLG